MNLSAGQREPEVGDDSGHSPETLGNWVVCSHGFPWVGSMSASYFVSSKWICILEGMNFSHVL